MCFPHFCGASKLTLAIEIINIQMTQENNKSALLISELESRIKALENEKIELRDNILASSKAEGELPTLAAILTLHIENFNELNLILEQRNFGDLNDKVAKIISRIYEDFEVISDIFGWEGQDNED
jgi:hemerythrin-like domain-containing protein